MFNILASVTSSVASVAMAAALTLYPETGIITNVDAATDIVEVSTLSGEVFAFYGVEDWETGDFCSMLMDGKGTETITDDEVVQESFAGNVGQFTAGDDGVWLTYSNGKMFLSGTTNGTEKVEYINSKKCVPVEDIACWFIDPYGYLAFGMKDVGNQFSDPDGVSYAEIIQQIPNECEDYKHFFRMEDEIVEE